MLEIEITKIERKNDWKNRSDEWGEIGAKIHFNSPHLSQDFVPGELAKYFSNIHYWERLNQAELRNLDAFKELQLKNYYVVSKDELQALVTKAFSDKIAERVFEEATAR